MLSWLFKRQEQLVRTKEIEIGDGNLVVDIPWRYTVRQEEDKTTVVFDPSSSAAAVRFSTLYLSDPKDPDAKNLAFKNIRGWAKQHGQAVKKHKNIAYSVHREASKDGDDPGEVYYWLAGMGNSVVVVSCWVSETGKSEPAAQAVVNSVEPAVRSLRESKVNKYKLVGERKSEITRLLPEHQQELDDLRTAAVEAAKAVLGNAGFTGGDSDLKVIQALLDSPRFDRSQPQALQGLGIIMGGILARRTGMEWVSLTDDQGTTPALHHAANVTVYPRDLIVKRVERGERVNAIYLADTICEQVQKIVHSRDES